MTALTVLRNLLQDVRIADAIRGPGLVTRNVKVRGHRTSMRLEPSMWHALKEICQREGLTMNDLCTLIASAKSSSLSLTAALRVVIANYYRTAATEEGHARAGHGRTTFQRIAAHDGGSTRIPSAVAGALMPAE